MAIPINEFDPIKEASKKNLVAKIRRIIKDNLGTDIVGLTMDEVPSTPNEIIAFLDASGGKVKDQHVQKELNEAKASLSAFLTERKSDPRLFANTKEVNGDRYIKLGEDRVGFKDDYQSFLDDISEHMKSINRGGQDEFSSVVTTTGMSMEKSLEFKNRYRKLIGLDEVLAEQGSGNPVISLAQAAAGKGRRAYSTFSIDPKDPNGLMQAIYRRLNLQITPNRLSIPGANPTDAYDLSNSYPKMSTLEAEQALHVEEKGVKKLKIPEGSQAILDIETAGLHHESGMWEMSVRYSGSDDVDTLHFKTPALDKGVAYMPETKKVVPLSQALMGEVPQYSTLDDFKRVLNKIADSDYIVGHNAGTFDLPFVMSDIDRIGAQLLPHGEIDDELMAIKARIGKKIKDGKVIDTLSVLHTKADELGLEVNAELLARNPKASVKSLQNMLLETNLIDLVAQDHFTAGRGSIEDMVAKLAGSGTHAADVDTLYTAALSNQSLLDGIRPNGPDGLKITGIKDVRPVIEGIVSSKATSPYAPMQSRDIDPKIRSLMERTGQEEITPAEQKMLLERIQGGSIPTGEVTDVDHLRLFQQAGEFDKFKESIGGRTPTSEEYAAFQHRIAALNLPGADLSYEERLVGSALANVSTPLTQEQALTSHLDGMLPTSSWFSDPGARAISSQKMALSPDILRQAEEAGVFDAEDGRRLTGFASGEEIFPLSPFSYGKEGAKKVNVASTFFLPGETAEEQQHYGSRLFGYLESRASEHGIDQSVLKKIQPILTETAVDTNPTGISQFGIQVGLARPMDVTDGNGSVKKLYSAVVGFMTGDEQAEYIPRDFTGPTLGVGYLPGGETKVGGRVVSKGGAARLLSGVDDEARSGFRMANERTASVFGTMSKAGDGPLNVGIASRAAGTTIAGEKILKAWETYGRPHKNAVMGGVAAVAGLGGYYMYRKHQKKQEYYTDTTDQMPYEQEDWYNNYQSQMDVSGAPISGRGRIMPNTNNVVSSLDRNKIGHTMMGSQKNSHLFGG